MEEKNEDMDLSNKDLIKKLKKQLHSIKDNFPVLEEGEGSAIELDPNNPSHVDWYEGK